MRYVNVIVPLSIDGVLTYSVPDETATDLKVGMRVLVPLGKKKIYTGIVYATDVIPPDNYQVKPVINQIDESPIITQHQIKLWEWIADYYMCTLGEVYKAAIPSVLKLESETHVSVNDDFIAVSPLPPSLQRIMDCLSDGKEHTIDELVRLTGVKSVVSSVNRLIDLGAVTVDEHVTDKYKPRYTYYVSLNSRITTPELLQQAIDSLRRAPKQQQLLLTYLDLTKFDETAEIVEYPRDELLKTVQTDNNILRQLVDKQIFSLTARQTDRKLTETAECNVKRPDLTDVQKSAFNDINKQWETKDVVLLHGVTSSGKTEIYIKLIETELVKGRQVLYLVPEIALTTQLTDRLQAVFGERLGIYHSKFSDAERAETYRNLLTNKSYDVIIGVRSSVFLPFRRLGLVIVDEEHDGSYKQQEPAPRYHARNAAIMLAVMSGAKVLLGTATPSMESYQNAINGKFGLTEIKTRYRNIRLPEIELVDLKQSYQRKEIEGHFSDILIKQIGNVLENKRQVILFQNRRGFAPYISCTSCGYVPKCVNCDVSLTVHKRHNLLTCHYCGYSISIPVRCPSCGKSEFTNHGFGTERIEDEISKLFPSARIGRMDLDTTHTRHSYEKIIHDFSEHRIDILVGTQMVTKGLHFDDVSLVAVLNADSMLGIPDFRAFEHTFQMLEQVSGRAGRKDSQGIVMIQTRQPESLLLQQVKNHDFIGFFQQQIAERQMFRYPPFYWMIQIVLKHRDESKVRYVSEQLQRRLTAVFGKRVSTVIVPVVAWVQNMHIRNIVIKIEKQASYPKAKQLLRNEIDTISQLPDGKSAIIYTDVDPL